jgi:Rab3 GTPase-activating protein catalytic subunit
MLLLYWDFIIFLGNLWHELWETSKAVPAVKQAPLFDEDLAV